MLDWFRRRTTPKVDVRTLKESAAQEMARGRWEKALPELQALVAREPGELQHRIRLGNCLRHVGRPHDASQQWLHAVSGWAAKEQWDRAIAACRLVLSVCPEDQEVLHQLEALARRRRLARQVPARSKPEAPHGKAREAWTPARDLHAVAVEGWADDERSIESSSMVSPALEAAPPPAPAGGEAAPASVRSDPVAESPGVPHEADEDHVMPESVFEHLHASFSSGSRGMAQMPIPVPPPVHTGECSCGACARCFRKRRRWRVVHSLDHDPVIEHVTE